VGSNPIYPEFTINTLELSPDQQKVLEDLQDWFSAKDKPQYITLGGYAGTGKTTLIAWFRQQLHKQNTELKVAFCSYTGKAARVLRTRLNEEHAIHRHDSISTIHALIYTPIENDRKEIVGWERKQDMAYNLIIVDEASMIDTDIWNDLLRYQIPILAVGDHGQLPPIKGNFNLMQTPQLRLEKIHRQAEGNPIIALSILAREEGEIPVGKFAPGVRKLRQVEDPEFVDDLRRYSEERLILCGYNTTRVKLNKYIRNLREFESEFPRTGDRVICLRNNHTEQIYNGMLGTIRSIGVADADWYDAEIDLDNEESIYRGKILASQFNSTEAINFTDQRYRSIKGDLFDFGYAITVHKAQGSQAPRVILFEERFKQMDEEMWRRWLYTAVTRAESELFIIA
jgi:exodeoxyribonuclease-5